MTYLAELRGLQKQANRKGIMVTFFVNEDSIVDQAYISGVGLRDPVSTAEYLRAKLAK